MLGISKRKILFGLPAGLGHGSDTCAVAQGPALKEAPHLVKCSRERVFKFFIFEQGTCIFILH